MLRKLAVLSLAAALLVGGADTAFAQRGGRGGGGGGRGYVGGGGRGYYGGGGRGWEGGRGWGGFGAGVAVGAGLGYGLGGGYYGGYPGYYNGGAYSVSDPLYVDPAYRSGVVAPAMTGAVNPGYMAAYPPQQSQNT